VRYLIILCLLILASCAPRPYTPPEICESSKSVILERIPDVHGLSQGLLTIQMAALETVEGYSADDANVVLDQIDALVDSADNYATLVVYITNKLNIANSLAGAMIFIIGDDIQRLSSTEAITPCDKALIKAHIEKERLLLMFYQ